MGDEHSPLLSDTGALHTRDAEARKWRAAVLVWLRLAVRPDWSGKRQRTDSQGEHWPSLRHGSFPEQGCGGSRRKIMLIEEERNPFQEIIEVPAPTAWPMITAFGLALLAAGL